MSFSNWLLLEMKRREWNNADLARKAGLSRQAIGYYLGGRIPSNEACQKIAHALGVTPDEVLRHVGILTDYDPKTAKAKELQRLLELSSPQVVDDVLEFARHRLSLARKRGESHADKKQNP